MSQPRTSLGARSLELGQGVEGGGWAQEAQKLLSSLTLESGDQGRLGFKARP